MWTVDLNSFAQLAVEFISAIYCELITKAELAAELISTIYCELKTSAFK